MSRGLDPPTTFQLSEITLDAAFKPFRLRCVQQFADAKCRVNFLMALQDGSTGALAASLLNRIYVLTRLRQLPKAVASGSSAEVVGLPLTHPGRCLRYYNDALNSFTSRRGQVVRPRDVLQAMRGLLGIKMLSTPACSQILARQNSAVAQELKPYDYCLCLSSSYSADSVLDAELDGLLANSAELRETPELAREQHEGCVHRSGWSA